MALTQHGHQSPTTGRFRRGTTFLLDPSQLTGHPAQRGHHGHRCHSAQPNYCGSLQHFRAATTLLSPFVKSDGLNGHSSSSTGCSMVNAAPGADRPEQGRGAPCSQECLADRPPGRDPRSDDRRSAFPDRRAQSSALLRDKENYPFVNDVIKQLEIGRTAFYRHFPPERIRELRPPYN